MIKIFLFSFLLFGFLYLVSISNIFAIFAYKAMFYIALIMLIVALVVTNVALQKYKSKRMKNEEDDK